MQLIQCYACRTQVSMLNMQYSLHLRHISLWDMNAVWMSLAGSNFRRDI